MAATLALAAALRPVGLTEILLIVLVEVVAVALVAGRAVAALTATAGLVAVNWLLVPPYGTLAIADPQNWVTLAIFLLLSVGASTLVEALMRSEGRAATAAAREAVLAEVLRPQATSALEALEILRTALELDSAALLDRATGAILLATPSAGGAEPVWALDVEPGVRVQGWGDPVLGGRREYLGSLSAAVVRAWESERLVAEQERAARLAELDSARGALLASIGHDLRTPLAAIRVSAGALALAGPDLADAERAELLASLQEAAARLDRLLDAVLDAARLETGALRPAPATTDVRAVVLEAIAGNPSDRLRVELPEDANDAVVDPALLERVLANLIDNALAHTPPDSPVAVSCVATAAGVVVTVVDHGQGLEEGAADTGRGRHGMGLVIVDRLARFAGLGIDMSPTNGGGLTVTVTVPGRR